MVPSNSNAKETEVDSPSQCRSICELSSPGLPGSREPSADAASGTSNYGDSHLSARYGEEWNGRGLLRIGWSDSFDSRDSECDFHDWLEGGLKSIAIFEFTIQIAFMVCPKCICPDGAKHFCGAGSSTAARTARHLSSSTRFAKKLQKMKGVLAIARDSE